MGIKAKIGIYVLALSALGGCVPGNVPQKAAVSTPVPAPTPGIWSIGEVIPVNRKESRFTLKEAANRRTVAPGTPIAGFEHVLANGWDDYLGQVTYRGAIGTGDKAIGLFSFACTKQIDEYRPYSFNEEYAIPVGVDATIGLRCPFVPDGKFGEQRLEFRIESIDERGNATFGARVATDIEKR